MGKKGGGRNAFVKSSAVSREDAMSPARLHAEESKAEPANAAPAAVESGITAGLALSH